MVEQQDGLSTVEEVCGKFETNLDAYQAKNIDYMNMLADHFLCASEEIEQDQAATMFFLSDKYTELCTFVVNFLAIRIYTKQKLVDFLKSQP